MAKQGEKQSKMPEILNGIGIFIIALVTPVGILYTTNGNILITAIAMILLLGAIIFLSKYLIHNKKREKSGLGRVKDTRTNNHTPEWILLFLYALVALIILPFMFHWVDVEFVRKKQLKSMGYQKLESLKNLETTYNDSVTTKINLLEKEVENLQDRYIADRTAANATAIIEKLHVKDGVIEFSKRPKGDDKMKEQISTELGKRVDDLKSDYDLSKSGINIDEYYSKTYAIFSKWKFLQVSYTYTKDIDAKFDQVLTTMQEKMPNFDYQKPEFQDMKLDDPLNSITSASGIKILLMIIAFILIHAMVLAEYLNANRKTSDLVVDDHTKDDDNNVDDIRSKFDNLKK